MTKPFSLYLDVIRFLAALAVFFHHLTFPNITRNCLWPYIALYGNVAVPVFFVLSGYVIAHVVSGRECRAGDYFAARLARLYSVVGIGLILTFVLDQAGMRFDSDFYQAINSFEKCESWNGFLSSALFLNEYQIFHFNGICPGSNGPYWSLSFEATYYLIAGLVLFLRKSIWIPLVLVILVLAGRTISILLPIWALGFCLYRFQTKGSFPFWLACILALVSARLIIRLPFLIVQLPIDNFGFSFPWGRGPYFRNVVADYLVAAVFGFHLISVRRLLSREFNIWPRMVALIRWLGSLTFPLYCFHIPVVYFLSAISPWAIDSRLRVLFLCAGTLTLVVILNPACEFLREKLRVIFRNVLTRPDLQAGVGYRK